MIFLLSPDHLRPLCAVYHILLLLCLKIDFAIVVNFHDETIINI